MSGTRASDLLFFLGVAVTVAIIMAILCWDADRAVTR